MVTENGHTFTSRNIARPPAPPRPADVLLLDLDEAARRLSLSRRSVERLIRDDRLRCIRIGRAVRVAVEELARFVREG